MIVVPLHYSKKSLKNDFCHLIPIKGNDFDVSWLLCWYGKVNAPYFHEAKHRGSKPKCATNKKKRHIWNLPCHDLISSRNELKEENETKVKNLIKTREFGLWSIEEN